MMRHPRIVRFENNSFPCCKLIRFSYETLSILILPYPKQPPKGPALHTYVKGTRVAEMTSEAIVRSFNEHVYQTSTFLSWKIPCKHYQTFLLKTVWPRLSRKPNWLWLARL